MAGIEREATVVWKGGLIDGSGEITRSTSGAVKDLPVTWASRTEAPEGKTSPEELIAAAHATCFLMGFSYGLANDGHAPESLEATATCTLEMTGAGPKIASMHFAVTGKVDGVTADEFSAAAQAAAESCPVSNALAGNVEVSVAASLA